MKMKNLIILILVVIFMFFSCAMDTQGEKEVTKEIITEKDNSSNSGYSVLDTKVYPEESQTVFKFKFPAFGTNAFAGNGNGYVDVDTILKRDNFLAGIFYHDNSVNSNDPLYQNVWRTLDLSANLSSGNHRVTMYIKVIETGDDGANELAIFKFRTPNMDFAPKVISQTINDEIIYTAELTTDENGCIDWCYAGYNAYDAVTINANPGFHVYKWVKTEIWLYESWKSDVISQ
jgi:hypothetical protein